MSCPFRRKPAVNRIEHRLFSYIAKIWRGQPLVSLATVVNLIGSTTTQKGLRVRAEIDNGAYPKGVVVKDEQMERIHLSPHAFHGDWNYPICRPLRVDSESSVSDKA